MHLGVGGGKQEFERGEGGAGKFVVSPSRDETTLAGKEKLQHKQKERASERRNVRDEKEWPLSYYVLAKTGNFLLD